MDTIRTRLSILIALVIIGYFVWQLTRPNRTDPAKSSNNTSTAVSLLSTVESGLESGAGLAIFELFQDQSQTQSNNQVGRLDAAGTYISYLSGDFTPRFKPNLANMTEPAAQSNHSPTSPKNLVAYPMSLASKGLVDSTVELAPVDPKAGTNTILALDTDNSGLILLPAGPENAAKRTQKAQFKLVLPLAGPIDSAVSLWHPETDSYMVCGSDGRVMMIPASSVVGSKVARESASFDLVTQDGGHTVSIQSVGGIGSSLGFTEANKRMEALPAESSRANSGISRFEIRDPVDGRNLLVGREGFEVDSGEDSSREIRDKRWVREQIYAGELDSDELDIETFQMVPETGTNIAKPSEIVLSATVDKALDDVFQPNTGKVFSDMMAMDKKDRESQLDNQVFQKLEKAKMDPGIKSILDYNEARYDVYRGENGRYEGKIENQSTENTKRLDKMISELDRYKIQKLAQEYYYLKMIRDETKGRTLPTKN